MNIVNMIKSLFTRDGRVGAYQRALDEYLSVADSPDVAAYQSARRKREEAFDRAIHQLASTP